MAAPIDPKIKAAALAEVLAGASQGATAKKYGLTRQAIAQWMAQEQLVAPVLPPEAIYNVGMALSRLMCVTIDTLAKQAEHANGVNWLDIESSRADAFTKLWRVLTEGVAGVVAAQGVGAAEEEPTPIRRAG